MADNEPLRPCEYWVLRYVPNPLQPQVGANLGVILIEVNKDGTGFADVRFTTNWKLARSLHPGFDEDYIFELEEAIRSHLTSFALVCSSRGTPISERDWMLRALRDQLSNSIEAIGPKAVMAAGLSQELKDLVSRHCDPLAFAREPETSGRTYIRLQLKNALHDVGAIAAVRKHIQLSKYTKNGDPFEVDYGYEFERLLGNADLLHDSKYRKGIRLLHAVTLKNNLDAARALAYAWPEMRDGMERHEQAEGHLTAIIEDHPDLDSKDVRFAYHHMLNQGITVRHVYQLGEVADLARRELRL